MLENLKGYVENMARRTRLYIEGKRISVFEDGWYFENMRIVAKRYYWGVFLFAALYITAVKYCGNNELADALMYLPITWLAAYACIVISALRQIKEDTKYIKKESLCLSELWVCKTFETVCRKIVCNWIVFGTINVVVLTPVLILYTFEKTLFIKNMGIWCACIVVVNGFYIIGLFREREAVFHTKFSMNVDSMELQLDLKSGEVKLFKGNFDFNLNGKDIVIVRDNEDVFFLYKSEQIESLYIKNVLHEAVYQYEQGSWREIVS